MKRSFPLLVLLIGAALAQGAPSAVQDVEASFLAYAAQHPQDVAFSALDLSRPGARLDWNADQPMPLASTRKVVVLAAYARAVAAGDLNPAQPVTLRDWERSFLPGTDGGAHAASLKALGLPATQDGHARDADRTVPLDTLARFMIETSDNAATDALMFRLGRARLDAAARDLNLRGQDPLAPLSGLFTAWLDPAEVGFAQLSAQGRADRSWVLARALQQPGFASALALRLTRRPAPDLQGTASLTDTRGTTRDYTDLLRRTLAGEVFGPQASDIMRRHLGWPMRVNPANASVYRALLAKGGSLPGVLMQSIAYETLDGRRATASLFLQNVPPNDAARLQGQLEAVTLLLTQDPAFGPKLLEALKR